MFLPRNILEKKLGRLLEEDVGQGDLTTYITIPENTIVDAEVIVKEEGIIAGIEEAQIFCESLKLFVKVLHPDGEWVESDTSILNISGDARALLSIERTLLNLLSRMSGIATTTNQLVRKVKVAGYKTHVTCTRKIAPGLSYFDKKAVFLGGGDTHRFHLDDLVLVKGNHLKIVGSFYDAMRKVRENGSFSKKVEFEVSSAENALKAAKAGVDIIMLDNFSPKNIRKTVLLLTKEGLRDKVLLEASGGINSKNILEFASTSVDIISIGAITHSAKALDINLKIMEVNKTKV